MTGDDDLLAILSGLDEFALPIAIGKHPGFDLIQRPRENCLEKNVSDLSHRLLGRPAIHLLGPGVPENDSAIQVTNQHRRQIPRFGGTRRWWGAKRCASPLRRRASHASRSRT